MLGTLLFALTCLAQDSSAQAKQLLAQGTDLIESKPAEAVRLLEQAEKLTPDLPGLHYRLGLAYHAVGDEADAEPELSQAAQANPDSAGIRNSLGIVLFQLGEAKSALEQFRLAVNLAPKDPNVRFNLAESLARTGETNAGVDELRKAAKLAPSDATLARIVRNVETTLASTDTTIKVDVQQVLVPVVVTDKQGHHVAGLTRDDFKLFEDGVEQKITAFSVESSGAADVMSLVTGDSPQSAPSVRPKTATITPPPVRRTYLIVVDTLHTSFVDFESARQALLKLFQQESSDDTQYVAIAVGASSEIIANITRDPNAILAALRSKKIQKIFMDGQVGGMRAEMERFRNELNDTRAACDQSSDFALKVKCESGIQRAVSRAPQIAELDRTLTIGFLREFRGLVTQLSRGRDRRTIVLVSDGFQLEPGREAENLVSAYFPFASHCFVPPDVMCPHSGLQTSPRLQSEFQPILQLASRSNITIDTIDSRGLYGQRAFDAASTATSPVVDGTVGRVERNAAAAEGNTLIEIAEATGGVAFHDNNNLLNGLQRAFADGRDYYTLAYTSTNAATDGKFRGIAVQVTKPGTVVNAKRGYWAPLGAQ